MSATPTQLPNATPALRTFFTPPPDCTQPAAFASTTWANNQIAYQLDSGVSQYTCYPSSYSRLQYDHSSWYSPGVCPISYEYAATSVTTGPLGVGTTYAVCCPPGMYTYGDQFSCTQVITSGGKLTFSETGDGATAFANPISVMWEEQDLALFTPASAPLIALSSAGITFASRSSSSSSKSSTHTTSHTTSGTATRIQSSSTGTSAASSPSQTADQSAGLSSGAAAGIGVGATIVVLALLAGIWWFIRRLRAKHKNAKREKSAYEEPGAASYYGQPTAGMIVEAPSEAFRDEADCDNYKAELDGGWQAPEAPEMRSPR